MINYLEILSAWVNKPEYLLIILIVIYVSAAAVDFAIGTINAIFTKEIQFSSRTAQLGIVRKLATLIVMILIIPLALLLPLDVGIYSLILLYIGIVLSEIYSILGHVGIVTDGDKHKNLVGTLFTNFIDSIYKAKGLDKSDKQ